MGIPLISLSIQMRKDSFYCQRMESKIGGEIVLHRKGENDK